MGRRAIHHNENSQPATLSTIASRLGISISTVSRALNQVNGIHPKTRKLISDTAAEVGYEPISRKKLTLNTKAKKILALSLGPDQRKDGLFLAGLSKASLELDHILISQHYELESQDLILIPQFQPSYLRSGEISGIVLLHRWPDNVVKILTRMQPVVSIVHDYPLLGVDVIGVDDRDGIRLLMQHLISRGHRKIGFFGYCHTMSWSRSRYHAYLESAAEEGLELDPVNVINVSLEEAQSRRSFKLKDAPQAVISRLKSGVTAWIGSSEVLAASLVTELVSSGIRVPADVAVTGYHSDGDRDPNSPHLTSTFYSSQELGITAFRRLVTRIDNPKESPRSILLRASFLHGEST